MNTTNYLRNITSIALGLTLLLQGSLSWADDIEMYFGQIPTDIKPNVFFILDDSGSMAWCLDKQNAAGCPKNTRMDVLKKTMNDLLDSIDNVNVGFMTLRRNEDAEASINTPVQDIAIVRKNMKTAISNLGTPSWTPIVGTLYDAARYLNADKPNYKGNKSPIVEECQPTHLVLLTDGQANKNNSTTRNAIKNLINEPSCLERGRLSNSSIPGETCGVELVKWMHDKDQASKKDGVQNIITYTIGFALEADQANKNDIQKFLKDLALAGSGGALDEKGDVKNFYAADDALQLSKAFNDIIGKVTQVKNTSFVNPSPAGGDFHSDENKKQIYYPMFQPVEQDRWPGNLKRYGLKSVGKNLVTVNVDKITEAKEANGQFKNTAQSWWNDGVIDGNDVSKGGAAWKLPVPNERHLWVGFDDYSIVPFPTVQTNGNTINLTPNNSPVIKKLSNDNEHKKLLRYIRGFAEDGKTARRALGDPLHSAPTLFSYECKGNFNTSTGTCVESADTENTSQMAIIGTNEGFVQMFNTATGIEQFAFMPEELLKNIKPLYQNSITGSKRHIYGMDNTVTVWLNDKDNNGTIDGDDKVYAYATMRRGGKSLYALDITDPQTHKPMVKWKISSGDTHFERLGETWSVPVKTKIIDTDGNTQDVLIFGGGYDDVYDNLSKYKVSASQGNDIYIVNAETGKFIWSASSSGFDMQYSIPGNIRVLSLDDKGNKRKDGLATQFFVGDVGGQVWRFIMDNGELKTIKGDGENNSGILAKLGSPNAGHGENARRFYHGPDVATEGKKLYVNIGSGYRAHPLDTLVHDRMYSLHVDLMDNGETLTEANLSPQVAGKFNGEQTSADLKKGSKGWFIELQGLGEKIISTPKTLEGRVIFNTYTPPKASGDNPCAVGKSENRTYDLRVEDATPSSVAKGAKGDYSGYTILSKNQGASGDPNVICFEGNCWVQFGPGEFSDPFSRQVGLGRKTYWIDLQQ